MRISFSFAETKYSTNPDECVDGVCYVPEQDEEENQVYAVAQFGAHHAESMQYNENYFTPIPIVDTTSKWTLEIIKKKTKKQ